MALTLADVGWAYAIVALGVAYVEGLVLASKVYDNRDALRRRFWKAASRQAFRFARKINKRSKAAGN
jgi:CHASE1-domain containing sensor protein